MVLAGLLLILAISLPVAVPPLVERIAVEKFAEFGLPASVKMNLNWRWRNGPGLAGDVSVLIKDSPWRVNAAFGASCCEWSAEVEMPETAFTETDPVCAALLKAYPVQAVSNLVFSGSVALSARAERTFGKPVPCWRVRMPIRNLAARATVEEKDYALAGLNLTPAASGLADHFDIEPTVLRVRSVDLNGFGFTNLTATVLVLEKSLFVSEASAELCGGKVGCYSLRLNPKNLNAGFTLFVDDVDAGATLAHVRGFNGQATGRLHGKVRLFVKEGGKALRLGEAFLYSTPGETGKLQIADATPVTDNLAMAGLDEATRGNVAKALTDLDYSVLRINLRRARDRTSTLSFVLRGTATRDSLSVPVDLTLNFNGELEQLINTGLGLSAKTKGKKQ